MNKMAYNFQGKKYIVTGAGGAIGRAIAENLASKGAKVFALDCVEETLADLVAKMPGIVPVHQDLRNWDETTATLEKLGELNGLVNCAGIFGFEMAVDVSKESLDKYYAVNLNAPINLMRVVGKKMAASGNGGSIVNISSCASKAARKGTLAYSVSKAGLDMATKIFAVELGPHKIRVNSVNPWLMPAGLTKPVCTEEMFQKIVDNSPLGQQMEVQNVVDLVLFLLSDQSSMITGTNNVVDGGMMCQLP